MLYKIREKVLIFHSAQEGQAIVFVALFCLVMALFAFMVINVGFLTNNRIQAQNSADAVAVSSAAWVARGLNIETMFNVTNAQILAWIIMIDAMKPANTAIKVIINVQRALGSALSAIPFTAAVGAVLQACATYSEIGMKFLDPIEQTLSKLTQNKYSSGLWKVMTSINKVQNIVKYAFPAMAVARAITVARDNGSEAGIVIPFYQALPVYQKDFQEFCVSKSSNYNPWGRATPQWLDTFQVIPIAMYTVATLPSLGPAVYFAVLHTIKLLYCSMPSADNLDDHIPNATEYNCDTCKTKKSEGKITKVSWEIYSYKSDPSDWVKSDKKNDTCNGFPIVGWSTIASECRKKPSCGSCYDPECDESNSQSYPPSGFSGATKDTATVEGKSQCYYRKTACDEVDSRNHKYQCGTYDDGSPKYCYEMQYKYQRTTRFALHSYCEHKQTVEEMINNAGGDMGSGMQGASTSGQPQGWHLGSNKDETIEDTRKKLQYLGIAYGKPSRMRAYIGPKMFKNPNPLSEVGVITFAQAEVYNATSEDLWTMDWRVRLVPARKIMGNSDSANNKFIPLH
jgi:hypothetical protein